MRLFIAVDLPDDVKEKLIDIQRQIGKEDAKISWVAKRNLHLTLKFLGEVSDEKAVEVKKVLKGIKFSGFEVAVSEFGVFPFIENPRVLWVGLKPEDEAVRLAQKIDEETLLISKADTQFKAHLTIGRVKGIKFSERFIDKLKKVNVDKIKFRIDSFTLYKSTLKNSGAVYEVVERYKMD